MRIGRTLPPAAAPISLLNLLSGGKAAFMGEKAVELFREDLKDYFGVDHCFLVSSGKAALVLILEALKVIHPERGEVLVPALNCFSVPSAITRSGLKVVLCDIDRDSLDFDYDQLVAKLENPRLLCVIPTHLFGRPADISRLRSMIDDPDVTIIEDAAQAFGGEVAGEKSGTLGDVSLFSLGRGKALSTVEGGIVMTNRVDLATQIEEIYRKLPGYSLLQRLKLGIYALAMACLLHPLLYWLPNSLTFLKLGQTIYDPSFSLQRLSPLQAGFARGWQRKIENFKAIRKSHVEYWSIFLDGIKQVHYGRAFGEWSGLIRFPWMVESSTQRLRLLQESKRLGLGVAGTYPASIARIPSLKRNFQTESFPVAEECARFLVTLPVHPFVRSRDKARIKQSILRLCDGSEVGI